MFSRLKARSLTSKGAARDPYRETELPDGCSSSGRRYVPCAVGSRLTRSICQDSTRITCLPVPTCPVL